MKQYLRGWNFMRLFRLVMGVIIIMQGWDAGYWWIVGIGAVFAALPLLNVNTCNAPICRTPASNGSKNRLEDVTYEEVK